MSNQWIDVCDVTDIAPNTGVCAKLEDQQVAVFFLQPEGRVCSIDNFDPIAKANILSRGIVGEVEGKRVVASPLYKQHFCLESGACLQDSEIQIKTYQSRINNNKVQILKPLKETLQ